MLGALQPGYWKLQSRAVARLRYYKSAVKRIAKFLYQNSLEHRMSVISMFRYARSSLGQSLHLASRSNTDVIHQINMVFTIH